MGVRGLSTLIKNRKGKFLEDYKLHDTKLIIDGSSLIYSIYIHSGVAKQLGGDYDNFARKCKTFFNNLTKCNITPIVVFDGAMDPDERKLQTTLQRMKTKLKAAANGKGFILPLLSYKMLYHVLVELNVIHVTCLFEADREVAVLANKWQCPVLSGDGDFYVYSLESGFIPSEFMIKSVPKRYVSDGGDGFFLLVKRYRCKKFLKEEFNMEDDGYIFPLFALLNGNDYFDASKIKLISPKNPDNVLNCGKHDAEAVLKWICRSEFETGAKAFEQICEQIPEEKRQLFKDCVDLYKDLTDFAFPNFEAFLQVNQDIVSGEDEDGSVDGSSSHLVMAADQPGCRSLEEVFRETTLVESSSLKDFNGNRLPSCFLDNLINCKIKGSFLLDVAVNHRHIFYSQVELLTYPSSYSCSREIRRLIYRIVLGPIEKNEHEKLSKKFYVEEYDREKEPLFVEPVDTLQNVSEIPSLWNILTLSYKDKLQVFFAAFDAKPESLDHNMDLASQVLILVSQLWAKNAKPNVTECHLTALFICIIAIHANELDQRGLQKSPNHTTQHVLFKDIQNAMHEKKEVRRLKMKLSRHFRISRRSDKSLVDRELVHALAQFQACFLHTYYLQQVLRIPVCIPSPNMLLNCTFIHSFYRWLKREKDSNESIEFLLGRGSAVHSLFTNWKASVLGVVLGSAIVSAIESDSQEAGSQVDT